MNSPTELKGACIHCREHIAFPLEALEQVIECPHCGRQTPLRERSFGAPAPQPAQPPSAHTDGRGKSLAPELNTHNGSEDSNAVDALKAGMAGFAKAASITARKAAGKVKELQDNERIRDLKDKAGKAVADAKDMAGEAASQIKSDPGRFRKKLILAGATIGILAVGSLAIFQPWKPLHDRDLMWAERGSAKAQYNVGVRYERGENLPKDLDKAIEWYEKAAEQGYVNAQYNLGIIHHTPSFGRYNPAKALEWYLRAAEQSDEQAKVEIGALYYRGEGVKKDYEKALEMFMAVDDHPESQFYIAKIHDHGLGVKQDFAEAIKWYKKGAKQDHPVCLYNLGSIYGNGDGVKPDKDAALDYFQSSADLGYADGWLQVGMTYATGGRNGKPLNGKKAIAAFEEAKKLGNPDESLYMGACYLDGIGVKKNRRMGLALMQKAARDGSKEAPSMIRRMQQQQMMSMLGGMFDFWSSMDGGGEDAAAASRARMDAVYEQWKMENPNSLR